MHPRVDRGNVRSDEQARNDPSAVSRRSPAPLDHTPATTKPPQQDHKDPTAVSQRPPVPPDHIPTTTDLPSRQDRKVPSATSDRPPVHREHTPATTVPPSLQDPKGASAAPSGPPVLPKHTPATIDPPSNSLSQPASGPVVLNRSKSIIRGIERVDRGAERAMERSPSVREEQNRVLAPGERENRLKDSADVKPNPTTSRAQDVFQYPSAPSESSLQRTHSSYPNRGFGSTAYLPDTPDDSQRKLGLSSGHSAEQPAAIKPSDNKYHPQSTCPGLRHASNVYLGAPEPPSGTSPSEERDAAPVPTERHAGEGPQMRVAGDEPQRAQRHQAKPIPEGGNSVGAQPPSTLISPRT
jgi:hypothetical protein